MRDIYERLRDIQEAIEQIWKYTSRGRDLFDQNELIQTWVIHHLEIIGEATRAIPQDFRNLHPEYLGGRSTECEISSFIITSVSTLIKSELLSNTTFQF